MPFIVPWINALYSRLLSRPSQVIARSDRVFTFPCVVRNECAEWAAPRYTILWMLFIFILKTWQQTQNVLDTPEQTESSHGFWLVILQLNFETENNREEAIWISVKFPWSSYFYKVYSTLDLLQECRVRSLQTVLFMVSSVCRLDRHFFRNVGLHRNVRVLVLMMSLKAFHCFNLMVYCGQL